MIPGRLAAADDLSSPFCVVPVRDGTPTEKDVNAARKMVSKVVTLPGVSRPIIYAYNRGGVWTIDENRAFAPFGGEFPSNAIHDDIARDPESGRFIGVNPTHGVFALDPGQTQFLKLYGSSQTLRRPSSVEFIPRFKGFIISAASGLYLLNRAGALSAIPIPPTLEGFSRVFDLPTFDAIVFTVPDYRVMVRFDDGEIIHVATLDRFDFLRGVNVSSDGSVLLETQRKNQTVRLSQAPVGAIVQGRSFLIGQARPSSSFDRLDAPSIGKSISMGRKSGLSEQDGSGWMPLPLPFDPVQEPINQIVEIPEYKAVFVLTDVSAYSLQDKGAVTEIPGARTAGVGRAGAIVRLIPVRNETIFLGRNSLNLLIDRRTSGEAACKVAR